MSMCNKGSLYFITCEHYAFTNNKNRDKMKVRSEINIAERNTDNVQMVTHG